MPAGKSDHYAILEQSREAAVQSVANLFDGLAKAKALRRRASAAVQSERVRAVGSPVASDDGHDALFELLKLNATYLNEVAKLGGRYRDLACRALESVYSRAYTGSKSPCADELVFPNNQAESTEARWARRVVIQNDADPNIAYATIDAPNLRKPGTRDWQSVLTFARLDDSPVAQAAPLSARQRVDLALPFQKPLVITVTANPDVLLKRKYEDAVFIRLSDGRRVRERRIALVLDGREPQPRAAGGEP